MSDFKWEMQERIDGGMSPDEAYNATRDSYLDLFDNRDKFNSPCCGPQGCSDNLPVCGCSCDANCECEAREESVEGLYTAYEILEG